MSQLQQFLLPWLAGMPHAELLARIGSVISGYVFLILIYLFARRLLLPTIERFALLVSPHRVGQLKVHFTKLIRRLAGLITSIIYLVTFDLFYLPTELNQVFMVGLGHVAVIVFGGFIFSSLISISGAAYNQLSFAKDVPILGLVQVLKLVTFIVTAILIVSVVIDKSPTYILSGFGALAAVLLLVFKDTILGFVASIQIAANRLVTNGDWIEFSQYGADGEVEEIGLNTVKVRNWDKTITTVPTYALISESFKNWRGMQESGGRRIKRALHLDLHSIRLVDEPLLAQLQAHGAISEVMQDALSSACLHTSNVSVFRCYAERYLAQHPELNQNLTLMIRELAPTQYGLPIELYCFSSDKRWIPYEHLQADIMDHLFACLGEFGLRPYQSVSGQLS